MTRADRLPIGAGHANSMRIVLWIVAVQILFWGTALLIRPPVIDPVFEQHRLSDIRILSPDGQQRTVTGHPNYYLGQGREARFLASTTIDRPDRGLVVFAPRYNRWAELRVNGQFIPLSDSPAWRAGRLGGKWVVPPGFLKAGSNSIALDIRRECCRAYLASLIVAPPGPIDIAIRQWRLQSLFPAVGLMVLGLFGAFTCLMAAGGSPYRQQAHAAALAFTGMALGGLWQVDILTPSSEPINGAAGQLTLLATFAGMVALADRWFPGGPRYDRPLVALTLLFGTMILAAAFTTDGMPVALRNANEILMVLLANVAIIASVVRGLKADADAWISDAAVVLLVPAISLADLVDSLQVNPLALNVAPLGVLALAVLLLLGIVRRARKLSMRLENANMVLDARIAEKQAELEATAALLRQREAEAAVQGERSRIMRDLHDGLGSQLMSIMLSARVGIAEPAAVAEGLQSVIDEMRLMVDSMDSVGESLSAALATFKARVQPRIEATGLAFDWQEDPAVAAIAEFGPRDVLQIFRVLQEAVTNALKHSGCSTIAVRAICEAGALVLTVEDDGKGITATGKAGRGLSNMQLRAASVQGQVAITPGTDGRGTRIRLSLPLSMHQQVAAE
jgi:signal transduction histidine kinase